MVGIRPERFEDASVLDDGQADRRRAFEADVDVVEWLGNEQYAYIPYETRGARRSSSLDELERDLDSERMRSQLVVALDPASDDQRRLDGRDLVRSTAMHIFDPASGENLTHRNRRSPAST